jgi:hypothetical protein
VDLIKHTVDSSRQLLVDRITDEFWLIFSQEWTTRIAGTSEASSNKTSIRSTSVISESSPTSQLKRQRANDKAPPDDEGHKNLEEKGIDLHLKPSSSVDLSSLVHFGNITVKHRALTPMELSL